MEILQLRYFYESAKNENFAKTAQLHMVPTSSVSASVKRLENELGCKLFDRTHNRITLNDSGKRLQQTLCLIFSELDKAVFDITDKSKDNREIKMLVKATRSKITDCIIGFKEKYPLISFKTVFDFSETDFSEYDIIIDEKKDNYESFESFELFNMKIKMMVSKSSPLAGKSLTLKQLSNHSFVSLSEQSNMHKILMNACDRAGFIPNITVFCNDIKCHEKLIESGIGIGLGRELASKNNIAFLDIKDFDERYTVFAYYKKQAAYGNIKCFLDFLKSQSDL